MTRLGDFQMQRMETLSDPCPARGGPRHQGARSAMAVEEEEGGGGVVLEPSPELQEQLVLLNTPDPLAGEQVGCCSHLAGRVLRV